MKFLHTADWHLGKTLKGVSLIDDQYHILNEIINVAEDEDVDAIIIAGDIYDRSVPPIEAVDLFSEVLTKILLEKKLPVLCISGNHDSAVRLNFATKLLERSNLYLHANLSKNLAPVTLKDEFGKVSFSLIPFVDSAVIKNVFTDEEVQQMNLESAFQFILKQARAKIPKKARSVAIAHQFVAGSFNPLQSDSERIFVGAQSNISPAVFEGYHYVALGHLHAPQKISKDSIRYSGSPLKYSFDESEQKKGVQIVEIDGTGEVELKFVDLKPNRDVRIVEGNFKNILDHQSKSDDYILVRLTDDSPILNARDRLQTIFPNILAIERNFSEHTPIEKKSSSDLQKMSISDLFEEFYFTYHDEHLSEIQKELVNECIESTERGE